MSDISGQIFQWLHQNPNLSGFFTFVISAAESIAIIGTIIPGTIMMTAIGTLAGAGIIPLYSTIIWAILGAIAGDNISYWFGRYFKERLNTFWPFRNYPALLINGENFFHRYGGMSVFIGRFVGPVRALVPLIAGMLNMPPLQFTLANVFSAILWAPIYMLPGILLGAASLELPPDVAVHALISLLITGLFIILVLWMLFGLCRLISKQIEQQLTKIWHSMSKSTKLHPITTLLQHHDQHKRHGQLILGFYFIITISLLASLIFTLHYHPAAQLSINQIVFHTFRNLRNPAWDNIMLAITFLGDKLTLLPLTITLSAWLIWKNRWHTALHILILGILSAGGIFVIKNITHSIRPWGILKNTAEYSFPSGHVTLSIVFYFALIFLLIHASKFKFRKLLYWSTSILIILISISRLYLGQHWFTDVLGAWLLGANILILVVLSWNRRAERPFTAQGILITAILTLIVTYGFNFYHNYSTLKHDTTKISWPIYTISIEKWWQQQGNNLPLYRINRFGLERQILNLQWVDDIKNIETILRKNNWQTPAKTNWVDILYRVANIDSSQHLPLVEPLYFDKAPKLVLVKKLSKTKEFVILRLWHADINFTDTSLPLWVGTVEVVPSTYSWLFANRQNLITLTANILFDRANPELMIQEHPITLKGYRHKKLQSALLLLQPTH